MANAWIVIRDSHGWLFGDRDQAIAELDELAGAERGPGLREGGWPMTASSSVVPFPAANKSRKVHARFRDDWLCPTSK